MAQSNKERIGKLLDLLREGLRPYVEREMQNEYKGAWLKQAGYSLKGDFDERDPHFDSAALLTLITNQWEPVFGKTLDKGHRSYVHELRDVRNNHAHEKAFSTKDTERALDTGQRLLDAVSATAEAEQVAAMHRELRRMQFEEEQKKAARKEAALPLNGSESASLPAWRDVATPHPDVQGGNFQQAEFAADLWQVHKGEGSDEYRDPREFFTRTYLTEGLRRLLTDALRRLGGAEGSGDPVINLKTNFGGGKTHSMLALYHLFSGTPVGALPGVEAIVSEAGVTPPANVRRVVLVGQKVSPGQASVKAGGVRVRTFWGELAWQLGGAEGYALVREADETGTNPGEALTTLLRAHAPCVILIDEWVAYVRQLHEEPGLIGGTSETHFTFAQTLTEAVKAVPNALLVVSLPASDIEVGGARGREALHRLSNIVARVDSPWRPASQEESYEIVRRRLFEPLNEAGQQKREQVVARFARYYRNPGEDFPEETRETKYENRLRDSYPIHPELFDRLYSDWSSLEKFQRTRGVLRLMAKVIQLLWQREDRAPLIMPAHLPMDSADVQQELTRYLEDNWVPIVGAEVDGEQSLPLKLDRENANFGRFSAARRVARVLFLGSAPTSAGRTPGISLQHIKLGAAQPGDGVSHYADALRRLGERARYLYTDRDDKGDRYWFGTQPNVLQVAQDRARQYSQEDAWAELTARLRKERTPAGLGGLHISPPDTGDVPDDERLRLVVLGPDAPHTGKGGESTEACQAAAKYLENKGNSPRINRNMLLFLAPDKSQLGGLEEAIRFCMAWRSIVDQSETLNLNAQQHKHAQTRLKDAESTVSHRIPEVYIWMLVPRQQDARVASSFKWQEYKLKGTETEPIAQRAGSRILAERLVTENLAGNSLRMEMDKNNLWTGEPHVSVGKLWEYFSRYNYLSRLASRAVLEGAVAAGCASAEWAEAFACADGYDAATQRYSGLCTGTAPERISPSTLLVRPEAALAQRKREAEDAEEAARKKAAEEGKVVGPDVDIVEPPITVIDPPVGLPPTLKIPLKLKRYHGSAELANVHTIATSAGRIADAIIQHLASLPGASVSVTLEIEAEVPGGIPDDIERIVRENSANLKLRTHGFDEE